MKVLIVGSGGREHAIAWKCAQSKKVDKVFVAPGNPGMENVAQLIQLQNTEELIRFVKSEGIRFTIVGPEQPLAEGLGDEFLKANLAVIGPSKLAAEIEGSKVFAKTFMKKYHIPTADFQVFDEIVPALSYILKKEFPLVIKVDGLAAGKGVFICDNYTEAETILNHIMNYGIFGDAGSQIVIEEYLQGEEASLFAFTDGDHFVSTILSQDHKQLLNGDEGPNTGGMGAYAPALFTKDLKKQIDKNVIAPTLKGMRKERRTFKGILYAGVMLTEKGPQVLEFNCRLGDPETQVILPLLDNDLINVCEAILNKSINEVELNWKNKSAVNVVIASGGYPGTYEKGYPIKGIDKVSDDTLVFFAGVKKEKDTLLTNGGRVLSLTALGNDLRDAQEKVYKEVEKVSFANSYYRTDIAQKGIRRLGEK
ncbi:MAG: phosphoribosylamine--glycine ligase [Candidatus Cloacimonetes bacterium]|nr:phosphoribosylamine--glycine ligase [Candidatus Cloacimonadota bacterium]